MKLKEAYSLEGVPEKYLFLLSWLCLSLWLCGSQSTVENSERDGYTRPPTSLLRNLYAGQEATVRTGHGTTDWFQIGKGVCQGCIFSPCLFNLYAEYLMRNAGLEEAQAGIKIADDTTLMAESEEELKSLLMKVKEECELWCWRRLLRVPWSARRSYKSILKEISPGIFLEGMMLKLKLQYFGHSLEKTLMLGGIGGRRRRGRQSMR